MHSIHAKVILLLVLPALLGQAPPADIGAGDSARNRGAPSPAEPVPTIDAVHASKDFGEGIWPSSRQIQLILIRLADRVGNRYDLSREQADKLRDSTVKRWNRFAIDHRAELQPLLNEFIEMRMVLEPPRAEIVQAWASRALPLFDKYRGEYEQAVDEFRQLLTPSQRARFEVDALKYGLGMGLAQRMLKKWRAGEFDADDFWRRPDRRGLGDSQDDLQAREEGRQQVASHPGASDNDQHDASRRLKPAAREDQIALELLAWDEYVGRFIQVHGLDKAQCDAVRSCLSELKGRALGHRELRREEIAKLEARIGANTGTEEELADLSAQLVTLYGPIDDMFQELKRRIEPIPTVEQRAGAAGNLRRFNVAVQEPARKPPQPTTLLDSRDDSPPPK